MMDNIFELPGNIALVLLHTDLPKSAAIDLCDSASALVSLYNEQCQITASWQKDNARQSKELAEQSIKLMVINEIAEERDTLRAENERLSKQTAKDSIKLLVLNEVVKERDAAITTLRLVGQAATPDAHYSQLGSWIRARVDDIIMPIGEAAGDEC